MSAAIAVVDQDGAMTFVNDQACEVLRRSRDELIGTRVSEFVPEAERAAFTEQLALRRTGEGATYELPMLAKDGSIFELSVAGVPLRGADGVMQGSFATLTDITELKQAQQALVTAARRPGGYDSPDSARRALEAWADIFELAGWGFAIAAGESLTLMNPAYAEMHGYTVEELSGMPISSVLTPEERARLPEIYRTAQDDGHLSIEIDHLRKDGSVFPTQADLVAIKDDEGNVIYKAVFLQDISDRKLAEEALAESEKRFRQLYEKAPAMLHSVDSEGRIISVSDNWLEVLGYERAEVLGKKSSEFLTEESRRKIAELGYPSLWQTDKFEANDLEFIKRDGSLIEVILSVAAERDAAGNVVRSMVVIDDVTEKKRAEAALVESEERFRHLYTKTPAMLHSIDKEARLLDVSELWLTVLGYERDDVLGRKFTDFLTEESRRYAHETVLPSIWKTGEAKDIAYQFVAKDGRVLDISLSVTADPDYHSSTGRTTAVLIDVTEKKQAEEALRLQSEILQNMTEAVYLVRASDGLIVYTNPSFERLFGYGPGEMLGLHVSAVNAPTDKSPEETANEVIVALESTGEWRGEILNVKKDGALFWCHANVSTFDHLQYGTVWVTYHTDITEKKHAEEALRASEERFRGVLEAAPDAMVIADERGYIAMINTQTEEMFGYEREELIGQQVELLIPERYQQSHLNDREAFTEHPHTRPMAPDMDLYGVRKDGSEFPVDISLSTLQTDEGTLVTAAVRDVTARKLLEERLRRTREDVESKVDLRMRTGGAYGLSFREFTVLHHVADGLADKEIAVELGISPLTVQKHVGSILSKMEAASRTEAGVRAAREGLLDELVPVNPRAGDAPYRRGGNGGNGSGSRA